MYKSQVSGTNINTEVFWNKIANCYCQLLKAKLFFLRSFGSAPCICVNNFFPLVNNKMKNKCQLTDGHVQSVMAVFQLTVGHVQSIMAVFQLTDGHVQSVMAVFPILSLPVCRISSLKNICFYLLYLFCNFYFLNTYVYRQ